MRLRNWCDDAGKAAEQQQLRVRRVAGLAVEDVESLDLRGVNVVMRDLLLDCSASSEQARDDP